MKEYLKPEIAFLSFETEAIATGGGMDITPSGVGDDAVVN